MEASARRVEDHAEAERFELLAGDEVLGFALYRRRPGLIAFVHTEIADGHEGEGLGGELVRAALDSVRAEGLAVLPFCPFVNGWIQRHAAYADLVPEQYRAEFGL
jgi:uncharacterized protein